MSPDVWSADHEVYGASVRDKARRIFESFAGTLDERDAPHVVRAHPANADMDACMADAGHPEWEWSLSRTYASPRDPLNSEFWLAEPLRRWRSEDLMAMRPFIEAEAVMNVDDADPNWDLAVTACLSTVDPRTEKTRYSATPNVVDRLTLQWYDVMTVAGDQPALPPASTYLRCMDAADVFVLDDLDLPASEIGPAMSRLGPDESDIPRTLDDTVRWNSEGWQRLLAGEDEPIKADWACRDDVYRAAIDDVLPRIEEFAVEHADEIAAARRAWEQVVQDAGELGYHGPEGPLGGVT